MDRSERGVGCETAVHRHGCAKLQGRCGLDVQSADMKKREHGQNMIVAGHAVHVLAHRCVPDQCLLSQHGAFRTAGGAGGVDDQQRRQHIDVRIAVVARARGQQLVKALSARRLELDADDACVRQCLSQRGDHRCEGFLHEQRLHRGIGQNKKLFRHGQPPVDRHQHGAEPSAGVKQHKIIGMIGGEDSNAVAAADAEPRFQGTRAIRNTICQPPIGQRGALKPDRDLVRGEGGVALDEVGEIHVMIVASMSSIGPLPGLTRQFIHLSRK
jgi:hypothetical protein